VRKRIWIIALAAVVALGAVAFRGLHREEKPRQGGSGAALGLMLLEKEHPRGLYVLAVTQESPADRAGVQPGDHLLQAEGVSLYTADELDEIIDGVQVLSLTILRDGQQHRVALPTR